MHVLISSKFIGWKDYDGQAGSAEFPFAVCTAHNGQTPLSLSDYHL
jgi:hypothetical protein